MYVAHLHIFLTTSVSAVSGINSRCACVHAVDPKIMKLLIKRSLKSLKNCCRNSSMFLATSFIEREYPLALLVKLKPVPTGWST
ncbi:hypothetical protein V5799_007581 [Amblyomma americanum]|uniref:Secreted protein n=1 Tax=Amblyomma americanum TaxID=6943 RepID=A0AAQ4FFH4_AMBAM